MMSFLVTFGTKFLGTGVWMTTALVSSLGSVWHHIVTSFANFYEFGDAGRRELLAHVAPDMLLDEQQQHLQYLREAIIVKGKKLKRDLLVLMNITKDRLLRQTPDETVDQYLQTLNQCMVRVRGARLDEDDDSSEAIIRESQTLVCQILTVYPNLGTAETADRTDGNATAKEESEPQKLSTWQELVKVLESTE